MCLFVHKNRLSSLHGRLRKWTHLRVNQAAAIYMSAVLGAQVRQVLCGARERQLDPLHSPQTVCPKSLLKLIAFYHKYKILCVLADILFLQQGQHVEISLESVCQELESQPGPPFLAEAIIPRDPPI
jgi:hypothetical protein